LPKRFYNIPSKLLKFLSQNSPVIKPEDFVYHTDNIGKSHRFYQNVSGVSKRISKAVFNVLSQKLLVKVRRGTIFYEK